MDVDLLVDDGTRRLHTSGSGKMSLYEVEKYQEPYEDMLFESEEAARAYYDDYAGRTGFVTRVLSSRKSERDGSIISRGLGCRGSNNYNLENVASQKRGRRREGCTAMILVKREKPGRWVVRKFVRDHNHPLVDSMPKRRPTFVSFLPRVSSHHIAGVRFIIFIWVLSAFDKWALALHFV